MSYRLELDEPLAAGLRRIAREQLDSALRDLRGDTDDRNEAIHDARKRFKKVRAVLRLVRDDVGEDLYQRENVCYRDAGRELADIRDSWVQLETLDRLREHFADQLEKEAFAAERERLFQRHARVISRDLDEANAIEEVAATISAAARRIDHWPISGDFESLRPGLERVYRRGRKRMGEAYESPTFERFHEWRKRAKYLWYHLRVLTPAWSEVLRGWTESVHEISDLIGESNDLSELRTALEREPDLAPDETVRAMLLALIDRRRQELRAAAHPLGKRVYEERPERFAERITTYWAAARADGAGER